MRFKFTYSTKVSNALLETFPRMYRDEFAEILHMQFQESVTFRKYIYTC